MKLIFEKKRIMKTTNILILGVGGNVSQGIITAIKQAKIPTRIIGACISPDSLGLYMCDSAYISPYANDKEFVHWVAELCNKENVSIVFTGVEEIVFALEENRKTFETLTKAIFISSEKEKLIIGGDKIKTVEWLKNNNLNYPYFANYKNKNELEKLITQCGFPLIAKPNKGKGSSGIIKLNSIDDMLLIPHDDYCIQEYLGDEKNEYTVACYVEKSGKQQELVIMRRDLKYGTTFMAEIVENELISAECKKICDKFKPKGPLNIQLRMHKGIPVCFELNVRFSGTTPIRARFGYNDVEALIHEYLFNNNIDYILKPQKKGRVVRYFNEFYIDLDMNKQLKDCKEVKSVNIYNNFEENRK